MLSLSITLQEPAFPDLREKEVILPESDIKVAVLDKGMESGRPSVAIRIDLPDGKVVLAETSARLFCTAAKVIMAKHPELFKDN